MSKLDHHLVYKRYSIFWGCFWMNYYECFFTQFVFLLTLSVLSSSCSWTCSVQFPLEAESHLRTTTSRSPSRKEATWGTSIKTGPRNLDPLGPTCRIRLARPGIRKAIWNRELFYFLRILSHQKCCRILIHSYFATFALPKIDHFAAKQA